MRLSQATENDTLNIMGKLYTLDYTIRSGGGKVCVKRVDTGEVSLMAATTECDKVEMNPPSLQETYEGLGIEAKKPFDYSHIYVSPEAVKDIQTWPDYSDNDNFNISNDKELAQLTPEEIQTIEDVFGPVETFVVEGESLESQHNPLIKRKEDDSFYKMFETHNENINNTSKDNNE